MSGGRSTTALSAATALAAAALVSPTGKFEDPEARTHDLLVSLWRTWETTMEPPSASEAAGGSSGCEPAAIVAGRDRTFARSPLSTGTPLESVGGESTLEGVRYVGSDAGSSSSLDGDAGRSTVSNEKRLKAPASRVESRAIPRHPNDAPRCDCTQLDSLKTDVALHLLDVAATRANNSNALRRVDLKAQLAASQESMTVKKPNPQCAPRAVAARRTSKIAYAQQLEALVHSMITDSLDILRENRSYRECGDSASCDRPSVAAK